MSAHNVSLYAMTTEMQALLECEEEVTQEQLDAAFAGIVKKDAALCHFVKEQEGSIAYFKAEEKRIADIRKAKENLVARVKEYAKLCMERLEMTSIEAGTFKLSIQGSPPALKIDPAAEIPVAYQIVIPATVQWDKDKVKEDLKAGKEVEGATLERGTHLRIR